HHPAVGDEAHRDGARDRRQREVLRAIAERRVGEMAAIELAEGEQVPRRRQHAEPRGEDDRMDVHRRAVGNVAELQPGRQLEQQRLAERVAVHVRRHRLHVRQRHAPEQQRDEDDEAADRAGHGDVEQRLASRERLADLERRAERPRQRRERQEEGERGVDVVAPAGEVMPHLVRAEDAGDGGAVREPVPEEGVEDEPDRRRPVHLTRNANRRQEVARPEIRGKGGIMIRAERSGAPACREEEQDVQPPPVLKPAAWRRQRRKNGQPPMFWRSLPGLKRIVRPGGMRTSLPVRGVRPMPRLRGLTWKTPNPRSSMRSPRCMEVRIASKTASTATSALTLVMSAIFDTSLTMSTLIMLSGSSGSVNRIYIVTYAVKPRPNCIF